jgi:predicted RNA-binding protein YlxR (DUF448 family)
MINKYKPQRMCIVCKGRYLQNSLIRLQPLNDELIKFSGVGRSFYLCQECIKLEKTQKIISSRYKLNKDKTKNKIKEILFERKDKSK